MKKTIVVFAITILLFCFSSKSVAAIEDPTRQANNRFGIHILFPAELSDAAKLVNSNGGDWGYITIPIQSTDRNLEKWQSFMDDCKKFHLVPIIRIATYPQSNFWTKPTIFDHLDFANFLNSLSWPTKNRYVIVYNEPNSNLEWGGGVDATSYAQELSYTIDAFKRVNDDFFIISAGLDSHAPNSGDLYKNLYQFLTEMNRAVPGIFLRIDGFASHSYPNKNFTENPTYAIRGGVYTYREETAFLKSQFGRDSIPIFITETGWEQSRVSEEDAAAFLRFAFENIWKEENIIAVTPFLLNGQGSVFAGFSMLKVNGNPTRVYEAMTVISKIQGQPTIVDSPPKTILADEFIPNKNFAEQQDAMLVPEINPPLAAFLKWLFGS